MDASLADAKAKPYQMWSFQGASVNWGKDEISPIPAKFARQNVMAAPVNDGHGGGIPVNAFWTRNVGLAIGHIETLPLVLTMPVRVRSDQRVALPLQSGALLDPTLREKEKQHREEKIRIARAAAKTVEEGQSVLLDSGTTTTAICPSLERHQKPGGHYQCHQHRG